MKSRSLAGFKIVCISMYYKKLFKENEFEFESWMERFWCPQLNSFMTLQLYRFIIRLFLQTQHEQCPLDRILLIGYRKCIK